ncbi:MAG: CpaF family protein [Eggerthellaceae bacterium]|nr:CpaF family protein [Eggerthellaceae bacterium]
MTLSERVQRAGNARDEMPANEGFLLQTLRTRVQSLVSVDELAQLAVDNPELARSELRSACRRAFEDLVWSYADQDTRSRLTDQLVDAVFGFGVLEDLITDETVTEIMVNGPESVYVERDGVIVRTERRFADGAELRALVDRILGPLGRRVDEASPMVNARLPQGHRVNVVVAPVGLGGPYVTIRKFASHVITLGEMESTGSVEPAVRTLLEWAVLARKSIAVVGGTGSGKTTLLNSLSCVIPHRERIVTIEDSAELRFLEHPHVVRMEARPVNAEGLGEITIRDLVINSLRMRPDRIIVGECRGAEALDMLQALNTGHDGSLTTLHANSPEDSIARLTTMVRFGADLPVDVIESNIASAIDLVVQMRRSPDGSRFVSDIVALTFDRSASRCDTVPFYRRPIGRDGTWEAVPGWVKDLPGSNIATKEEVSEWVRACSLAG